MFKYTLSLEKLKVLSKLASLFYQGINIDKLNRKTHKFDRMTSYRDNQRMRISQEALSELNPKLEEDISNWKKDVLQAL